MAGQRKRRLVCCTEDIHRDIAFYSQFLGTSVMVTLIISYILGLITFV